MGGRSHARLPHHERRPDLASSRGARPRRRQRTRSCRFRSPLDGVGLTVHGRLVRTSDAGQHWARVGQPVPRAGAICSPNPGTIVLAGQNGAVWTSGPTRGWTQAAPPIQPVAQYGGWWVDLDCHDGGGVELAQAFCQAACGGGIQSIVRETIDAGSARRWRTIARPAWGAGNEAAPILSGIALAGRQTACLIFSPGYGPAGAIRCTDDGGRTFTSARTPRLSTGHADNAYGIRFDGATFTSPTRGTLELTNPNIGTHTRSETQLLIWQTDDSGRTWRQVP